MAIHLLAVLLFGLVCAGWVWLQQRPGGRPAGEGCDGGCDCAKSRRRVP